MDIREASHSTFHQRLRWMRGLFPAMLLITAFSAPVMAQKGDLVTFEAPTSIASSAADLQPGQYVWNPQVAPPGQLVIVVSIPEQMAHVYRSGVRIGVSTVSTGKEGHATPTGTFEILQKKVMNYSNLYNNAPMPFMQRLTWDGIALHAGKIPGYPASHGCIRLPLEFAEKLYRETSRGMLVVVADETSHDPEVVYPGDSAPIDTYSGQPISPQAYPDRSLAIAAP